MIELSNSKKTFLGKVGSRDKFALDCHIGAVQMREASGEWEDIDPTVEEFDTDGKTVNFTKTPMLVKVGEDSKRRIYPDRTDLSYWIEFQKPFVSMGKPTRQNGWFYWNFAHAVLGVKVTNTGVKFGFKLKDNQSPTSITIPFTSQGITRQGRLLYHEGKVIAELRLPIATGSNLSIPSMPIQKDCDVSFGSGEVTISLDPTGLEYPIEIDPTLDLQVGASSDDCRRRLTTSLWGLTAANIIVGNAAGASDKRFGGGMRFTGITIPQGSPVTTSYLTGRAPDSEPVNTTNSRISAEDVDDAPTFADSAATFDARFAAHTTARIDWDAIPAWTAGTDYNSPEVKTVIQEIVDRVGWVSGNDIVIFWEDFDDRSTATGAHRYWHSYDGSATYAPKLHLEWTEAVGTIATPPTISLIIGETQSTLSRSLNTSSASLSIGEQIPYYNKGQYAPTLTLKTTPNTSQLNRILAGTTSNLKLNEKEGYLRKTFGMPVVSLNTNRQIPITNRGFIPSALGLNTTLKNYNLNRVSSRPTLVLTIALQTPVQEREQYTQTLGLNTTAKIPVMQKGFIFPVLILGSTLFTPNALVGTIATPATMALILTEIAGSLGRISNRPTLDLKLSESESYLTRTLGVPLVSLNTSSKIPVMDKGFVPPALALNTTLRDYNLSRISYAPTLVLNTNTYSSRLYKGYNFPTIGLSIGRQTTITNRGFIPAVVALGINGQTGNLQIAFYVPAEIALALGLQIPDVRLVVTTIVTPSTALLMLQMFNPELFSGVFPISITGRYGVGTSASWEGVLTATNRYGVQPSVSNEGIVDDTKFPYTFPFVFVTGGRERYEK